MTGQRNDILVPIPEEHLPRLATLYEKHVSWAPYMVSFVHMAMRWKKSEKFRDAITFMSPNNSWEKDGTIVATIQFDCCDIVVFTLDDQCTSLYEGLIKTDLIDYSKKFLFFAVHEKHIPVVTKFLELKKINLSFNIPTFIYALPPEDAKALTIECPPDVYVKELEPSAAEQVNEVWPHKSEGSARYLAKFIEINGGYGVFVKSTDELVAWVLKHEFGHLAMLQTEEGHKKKGYGTLVAKVLSKKIGEEDHWPVGTILLDNRASIKMFEKIGFHKIGICNFMGIEER